MNSYLLYTQILYALLIPAQIFAALWIDKKKYKRAVALILVIMLMEAYGIQSWILAQSSALGGV